MDKLYHAFWSAIRRCLVHHFPMWFEEHEWGIPGPLTHITQRCHRGWMITESGYEPYYD